MSKLPDIAGFKRETEDTSEPLWGTSEGLDTDVLSGGDDDELYAVLNLEKTCTQEEVQRSYRRLAALLHPDRHPDPSLKAAADSRFQAVNRAYEILSNEDTRVVYDSVGLDGLQSQWKLTTRGRAPDEIRTEYSKLKQVQLEKNIENLVKSKGDLTCIVDARALLMSDEEIHELGGPPTLPWADRFQNVQTRQMVLKHNYTLPVSESTGITMTSQLLTRKNAGGGNIMMKVLHRHSDRLQLELGTTYLRPRALSFKVTYAPDDDSFIQASSNMRNVLSPPPFNVIIGHKISKTITSTFGFSSGNYALLGWGEPEPLSSSGLSLGFISDSGWSIDFSGGLLGQQVSLQWSRMLAGGVRIKLGGVVTGDGSVSTHVNSERKLTEHTKGSLGLELAGDGTMSFKVGLSRLGQTFTVPILISNGFDPLLAIVFTVVPAASFAATNHWIIAPRRRLRQQERLQELQDEHREALLQKKKEAEEAIELLKGSAKKNSDLVVVSAVYGVLSDPEKQWDVTVPLQSFVQHSQLIVPGGRSKCHLLGFYDCAIGERKTLKIEYLFKGVRHRVEVEDTKPLAIPLRSHAV